MRPERGRDASRLIDRKKIMKLDISWLVIVHDIIRELVVPFLKNERKCNPFIVVRFKENLYCSFVYDFLCYQFCVDVYVTARVRRRCAAGRR